MRLESNGEIIQTKETKEEFIFDVRKSYTIECYITP